MPGLSGIFGSTGGLLTDGQLTTYHIGDSGDQRKGLAKSYTVLTTGQYSGTTNVDAAHYAANTIAFVSATSKITDTANLLATVLTGDTIRIRGSALNDGVYTVVTGGVAGEIVVAEALVDEATGAYVTICKRVAISNNMVLDNVTGRMWLRYTTGGPVLKVGAASNGKLAGYDATKVYTLHPAAADLQMTVTGLKIVGGAAELPRYYAGMVIDCAGFANAVNNLPGYRITNVAVNGADLDLTLWRGNQTLIAEAAAGARSIGLVCRNAFDFCAAANEAGVAGYTDYRVPYDMELASLRDMEAPTAAPDAVAFPSWPTADFFWSSTTHPAATGFTMAAGFANGFVYPYVSNSLFYVALVRGGV